MKSRLLQVILGLLLIADIVYSFRQHEHKPLDGDLAVITAPSAHYTTVLTEPFAAKAVLHQQSYAATNRPFCHQAMVFYYKDVYRKLAPYANDKIKFLYKFSGFFHLIIQLLIACAMLLWVFHKKQVYRTHGLAIAGLLSVLFQTHGYAGSIGIIDQSVTYTFFYAMPMAGWMLLMLPMLYDNRIGKWSVFLQVLIAVVWWMAAFVLAMSGPLISPLGLLAGGTWMVLYLFRKTEEFHLPRSVFAIIAITGLFACSAYSMYAGSFNAENGTSVPLLFRYEKWLSGMMQYFVKDLSFLLIAIILLVNLRFFKNANRKIPAYVWLILLLCAVYLVLLPFGGYRPYRPLVIRSDVFLPVTLILFYLLLRSTLSVLSAKQYDWKYVAMLLVFAAIFTYSDKPQLTDNRCQIQQIRRLQTAEQAEAVLPKDCPLLTWDTSQDGYGLPEAAQMLYYWGITDRVKPYRYAE